MRGAITDGGEAGRKMVPVISTEKSRRPETGIEAPRSYIMTTRAFTFVLGRCICHTIVHYTAESLSAAGSLAHQKESSTHLHLALVYDVQRPLSSV